MDRQRKTTDAYVEVRVAGGSILDSRTKTVRNDLNPHFNYDVRVEVRNEGALQDQPIEFRVMDSDVLSADDPVGTVYIDINPLLARVANARVSSHDASQRSPSSATKMNIDAASPSTNDNNTDEDAISRRARNDTIEGWFPIFDTMQGTRGDLYLSVRVQFFGGNLNPFRTSSAGIQFFSTSMLATSDVVLKRICGFVEELVVHDDPEYVQANRIRSAQKSNEMRLQLLNRLACTLRKQIGKKVQDMGGNAVLAYHQAFDIEGDSGLIARGYGTACKIVKASKSNAIESQRLVSSVYRESRDSDLKIRNSSGSSSGVKHHHHKVDSGGSYFQTTSGSSHGGIRNKSRSMDNGNSPRSTGARSPRSRSPRTPISSPTTGEFKPMSTTKYIPNLTLPPALIIGGDNNSHKGDQGESTDTATAASTASTTSTAAAAGKSDGWLRRPSF